MAHGKLPSLGYVGTLGYFYNRPVVTFGIMYVIIQQLAQQLIACLLNTPSLSKSYWMKSEPTNKLIIPASDIRQRSQVSLSKQASLKH